MNRYWLTEISNVCHLPPNLENAENAKGREILRAEGGFEPKPDYVEKFKEMDCGDHVALAWSQEHGARAHVFLIGTVHGMYKAPAKDNRPPNLPVPVPRYLVDFKAKDIPTLIARKHEFLGPCTYDPETCKPEWVKMVFCP